ncbi:Single hybrid motif [Trinorchestia longiramus]|nr:Single hybrid motif [Trinorchestia longiramus]
MNRLSNKVNGKGKRGAQVMGSKATLCRLVTSDEQSFDVLCGARGKLVQVNERLLSDPDLCRTSQGSDGWLAIVLPNLTVYDGLISALTPASQYEQMWRKQYSPSRPRPVTGTLKVHNTGGQL